MTTLKQMVDAKTGRDLIRAEIVKALAKLKDLPADVLELLSADEGATAYMRQAINEYTEQEGAL